MSVENALEISHLEKTFQCETGDVQALSDINLTIKKREFISILGASGCGKSTLLRIIGGLEHQSEGDISSHGVSICGPGVERGMAFQESRLFPWLTVENHIRISYQEECNRELVLRVR